MDEHADHIASGADAASSVDVVMQGIDWSQVHGRDQAAVHGASEGLGATVDEARQSHLVGVRRSGVFEKADVMAERVLWRDPVAVDTWAVGLQGAGPLAVCCVHGHGVSRAVALRLRAAGVGARVLTGGLEAWRASGQPLVSMRGA